VIENSGYGADKFTMVRNNDGTGSLKIVQPLDYEDQLQSNGFRFRIQVNDKVWWRAVVRGQVDERLLKTNVHRENI